MKLSIVIPVKDEALNLDSLYRLISLSVKPLKIEYEIIFVDDGSTDGTYEILKTLRKKDRRVKLVSFQANFGKAAALSAGFDASKGEYIITLDGDLQDDPREIPRFLDAIKDYDLVSGWKYKRKDPLGKTLPSKFFNALTRKITGVKLHDFNCGYKIYRREVVKNLNLYGELHRYIPAIASWKGYRIGEIKVMHHKRKFGKSKYGASRLIKGIFDLITVRFLTKFSKRPMHFFGSIGVLCIFFGFISGLYLLYLWLLGIKIGDRPLLLLTVLLIVLGVQFISLGLIGEMIVSNSRKKEYIVRK